MLILITLFWGCSQPSQNPDELLVFAAASLGDALNEIEDEFEHQHGIRVIINYGASQMLAQQIASGGRADVFISAGSAPIDFLLDRNLLAAKAALLTNYLVLVVRAKSGPTFKDINALNSDLISRISIANPQLSPAGHYSRESLIQLGIWDNIQHKLVFGSDVRATLAYVESGNVDVALVYATDAESSHTVQTLDIVPTDSYSPIIYYVAMPTTTTQDTTAMKFLSFLKNPKTQKIFMEFGFTTTN